MQGTGSLDVTANTFGEFVFRAFTAGTASQRAPNHAQIWNALAGFSPNFRGRNADTNTIVGLNFDGQKNASFSFSNNSFSNTLLNITGAAGSNTFIEITSGTNSAYIVGKGIVGTTNTDLALGRTGNGAVRLDYDPTNSSNSRELATTSWVKSQFAAYTGTALTPTGYVTITDSAGIQRRVLIG
jgi:hypothetical protein